MGDNAKIVFRPDMPTGPMNRVADNSLAKELLGWEPLVPFKTDLKHTIDWYFSIQKREHVKKILDQMLSER
jgi:nucleoside-diphosphate-sugar epimerase